jgi:hypothetical protein
VEHDRDAVALPQAAVAQCRGGPVLQGREFAVGDRRTLVADGGRSGEAGGTSRVGESAREIECG